MSIGVADLNTRGGGQFYLLSLMFSRYSVFNINTTMYIIIRCVLIYIIC